MTERELLELAAKAYWGEEIDDVCSIEWSEPDQSIAYTHGDNQDHNGCDQTFLWNPLEFDGPFVDPCGICIFIDNLVAGPGGIVGRPA